MMVREIERKSQRYIITSCNKHMYYLPKHRFSGVNTCTLLWEYSLWNLETNHPSRIPMNIKVMEGQ